MSRLQQMNIKKLINGQKKNVPDSARPVPHNICLDSSEILCHPSSNVCCCKWIQDIHRVISFITFIPHIIIRQTIISRVMKTIEKFFLVRRNPMQNIRRKGKILYLILTENLSELSFLCLE